MDLLSGARKLRFATSFIFSLLFYSLTLKGQRPNLIFQPVITSGLTSLSEVTSARDGSGRLFILQLDGHVKIYSGGTLLSTDFIDLHTLTSSGGERGLLSIAFHPLYSTNGFFFVYYTDLNGDINIVRYHTNAGTPNQADPASGKTLLIIPHPGAANHNGGHMQFGPDGKLYFATGDGGSPSHNAQDGSNLLGKMIRIDVDVNVNTPPYYGVPSDNPFILDATVKHEIWSLGLRNPYRWSFDRLNGNMWIGDVGQNTWEEVNFRPSVSTGGINYQWDCMEGFDIYTLVCTTGPGASSPPLLVYPHNNAHGGFAIIGGYVYRGTQFPAVAGYYFFGDYVNGNVWILPNGGLGSDTLQYLQLLPHITSFGESDLGELYATTLDGGLFNVTVNGVIPVDLISFTGISRNGHNELKWQIQNEQDVLQYEIQFSRDGRDFQEAGRIAASRNTVYYFTHSPQEKIAFYYRLKIVDMDGRWRYSNTILIRPVGRYGSNFIAPTIVSGGIMYATLDGTFNGLRLVSTDGKEVFRKAINGISGTISIPLPSLPTGHYMVQFTNDKRPLTQPIFIK